MTDDDKIAALEARLAEAEDTLKNFGNQLIALRATATILVTALNGIAPGVGETIRTSLDQLGDELDDAEAARIMRAILIKTDGDDITDDPDVPPPGRGR